MSKLKAYIEHPYFIAVNDTITFDIGTISVLFEFDRNGAMVTINGELADIKDLFFKIIELLFLYLGGVPKIKELKVDGCSEDVSQLSGKYKTSDYFTKKNLCQCKLNEATLNESVLSKLCGLEIDLPIYSMQHLVSEDYEHVVTNHKITLLLHVIDGVVDDAKAKNVCGEIKTKYGIPQKSNVGVYICKAYSIFKESLFKGEEEYLCEILQSLNVGEEQFLKIVTGTRHWYSHFLRKDKKQLKQGAEMLIYFEVVYYCIRAYILGQLEIEIDVDQDKEFYYSVHDWILEVLYNRRDDLKSKSYQMIDSFREMQRMVEELIRKQQPE